MPFFYITFVDQDRIENMAHKNGFDSYKNARLVELLVCPVCYENGLELDLGTSEWPNLLFYFLHLVKK